MIELTNQGVDHGTETVRDTTVLKTPVNGQELPVWDHHPEGFKITREPGTYELVDGIEQWVGKVHIVAPTATFWPEQDVPPSKHMESEPRVFMRTRTKEHMTIPDLTKQETKKVVSMTKTTEGSHL